MALHNLHAMPEHDGCKTACTPSSRTVHASSRTPKVLSPPSPGQHSTRAKPFRFILPYPLSCQYTRLMTMDCPATISRVRRTTRNAPPRTRSPSSTTKHGSRGCQNRKPGPLHLLQCGGSSPNRSSSRVITRLGGKSSFLKKPLSCLKFLTISMPRKPKEVTRDGVKGTIITVEEHDKFVPKHYGTGKKRGR